MTQVVSKNQLFNQIFETLETYENTGLSTKVFILSYGTDASRCQVKEFYGRTLKQTWDKLVKFYRSLKNNPLYTRVDLITEEQSVTYDEMMQAISEVPRNNYIEFGIRLSGFKKRCFLKEELTANALLVPDKEHKVGRNNPNLQFDERNYKGYIKRKHNLPEFTMNYFSNSEIYLFKTKAFFIEDEQVFELKDYGFGNQFRMVEEDNFPEVLDVVIDQGANYLFNQLSEEGDFVYGYYPCYDKNLPGYNSIRHFSSIYALLEAGEALGNQAMIERALKGLDWGFEYLSDEKEGKYFIKEQLKKTVEYKLGAQAMAILASAKYAQITGDTQYFEKMKSLTQTIEAHFLTENNETIHVLNEDLTTKEKFRIVYYDGEALFGMLRAYELMKDPEIFAICQRLMNHFVENNYEKYRDHWLSYAVNEFLKYEEKDEYYIFGMKNALSRIDFIEKRDTAYPTMLELLVAAARMMEKLEAYDRRKEIISDEEFQQSKNRILDVMNHRAYHEVVTGVMFPEFGMFFKVPGKINYGFFARHDRFRMRIDDAEHFLSGLVNFREVRKFEEVK